MPSSRRRVNRLSRSALAAPRARPRLPDDSISTRKAARTETDGHWAVAEAWQEPGFDNPPHTHDEAEAFYVLEGSYTFYTDADPVEEVGPGTFVFIPPGAVHGFRTGPQGGKLFCFWPSTVEAAFFNNRTDSGSR